MTQIEPLPRNIKIDWLRFQVESTSTRMIRSFMHILHLPFEKKQPQMIDARDTNILALNKVWHEVYEFQGSLIGAHYAPVNDSRNPSRYFVDLNGTTLSGLSMQGKRILTGTQNMLQLKPTKTQCSLL